MLQSWGPQQGAVAALCGHPRRHSAPPPWATHLDHGLVHAECIQTTTDKERRDAAQHNGDGRRDTDR
jgi:hypothetical protein